MAKIDIASMEKAELTKNHVVINSSCFFRVAKTTDIPAGEMRSFVVEGNEYLVANVEGSFYAIDNRCSHFHASLSEGKIDGRVVTCPRRHACFDVITGKSKTLHIPDLCVYCVKVEGEDILIEI